MSHLQPCLRALALVVLWLTGFAPAAGAASKAVVATLGGLAPGGGVFAGPGFTGWPTAAGDGWVAFRGLISGGATSEAIVVAHIPVTRAQVARIGQPAPGGGTFKRFVGRPAVNVNGDVAFLALVTRAADAEDNPLASVPAGIFLYHEGVLTAVAHAGDTTAAGTLDLSAPVDPTADPGTTQGPEQGPAINDAGDVAFVSALRDNPQSTGAVFLARSGNPPQPVVRIGDPYDGGAFTYVGPPALNNHGVVAFHATASTTDPNDCNGTIDGIFVFPGPDGTAAVKVHDGMPLTTPVTTLEKFEDPVALNDDDHIAFIAGPLVPDDDTSAGVLVFSGGMVTAVAYPGQALGGLHSEIITGLQLGPGAGNVLTAPSLAPDGRVAVFVSINSGTAEAIAVWDGATLTAAVHTAGPSADVTPAAGFYSGAESAPAIDASGGIAFLSRIAGGASSEAIVYRPAVGESIPLVVGDASPTSGFFGGPAFSPPLLNDRGDVVFRAYVAHGPASVGIFRWRGGVLAPVVRSGDPAPAEGTYFTDLLGQPSLNQQGAIAFGAQTSDGKVGLYVADDTGIRSVVIANDVAPGTTDAKFRGISTDPALNDAGAVAFRANTFYTDPDTHERVVQEGIFLADASGIRALVLTPNPSPAGKPFARLRDPVITNAPSVVFRAVLAADQTPAPTPPPTPSSGCHGGGNGTGGPEVSGLFVADPSGVSTIAVEQADLGGGIVVTSFTGDPVATGNGRIAFLANRARLVTPGSIVQKPLGISILQGTTGGLALVIARDMRGPAGGTFRSISQPTMNSVGHIAFRGSFLPFTGGTTGFFLETDTGLEPYIAIGETTPIRGHFTAVGTRAALNANDDLAFTASVSGGASRNAVFVASRTTLQVPSASIRLTRRARRDRIRLQLLLQLGRFSDGIDPAHEPVTVSLASGDGTLWSATVAAGKLRNRGRTYLAARRFGDFSPDLHALRLQVGRDGNPRIAAVSVPLNLTHDGQQPLQAPVSVTVQVGDDSGTRVLPCRANRQGIRCTAF